MWPAIPWPADLLVLARSMDRKRPRPGESTADALRRLASARVSGSALSDILRQLRFHGGRIENLPTSRYSVESAVLDAFDTLSVSETLQLNDGSEFTWEFIDPELLPSETVRRLPLVAATYQHAMTEHPQTVERPWDLIIGQSLCRNCLGLPLAKGRPMMRQNHTPCDRNLLARLTSRANETRRCISIVLLCLGLLKC